MLRGRNCLFLGAATLGVLVGNGCWVGSNSDPSPPKSFASSAGAAHSSAGAASSSAGAAAISAGASGAGAPSTAGAGAGGAPGSSGAPSSAGSAGSGTAGAATAGSAGAPAAGGAASFPTGCAAPTGTHPATALDRSCWVATASDCATSAANSNLPAQALDGKTDTRFSTGLTMNVQTAPFTYELDMGSIVMIAGLKLDSMVATDFAPQLEVQVSTDHSTWNAVACGAGMVSTDFSFAATSARYVRLTQLGMTNTGWWSVWELNVYGATANDKTCATPGTGPTSTACATPHP